MEIDSLLRAAAERLKRIAGKRKRGQKIADADLAFLSAGEGQTYFDSIASAAAAVGISAQLLRLAKKAGAPGFQGSRVYPEKLLPWLVKWMWENSKLKEENSESLERRLLQIEIQRKEFRFAAEQGKFISAADASAWTTEMVGEFTKVLDAIPSTLAPDLAGCTAVAECELRIRATLEEAKRMLHAGPWGKS